MFDPSRRATLGASQHEAAARELPLRRDMETFLRLIRDQKVTGTQSTGNLPLKAVAEVSAGFVHPPVLERNIRAHVYRFRSEEDVWPLCFVHVLAQGADPVTGGPGRGWCLTPWGEQFLSVRAALQVLLLLSAWW